MSTPSEDEYTLLGESTYEILTDSTILTDDDEASSVASLDDLDHSEDNNSLADSESLADFPTSPQDDLNPGIPTFGGLDEQHLNDSGMTLKEEQNTVDSIIFTEPEQYAGDQVSVSHTICEFTEAETKEIYHQLRSDETPPIQLSATVRQTMTKQLFSSDEPFRVLYVGATSAKDDIITKLGAALTVPVMESSTSSSSWDVAKGPRFNVIPVSSFGNTGSSPEVELVESFGVEMVVDVCSMAKATKVDGRPDTLSLWLNGNQCVLSCWGENGLRFEGSGWKLPHLMVIFCSDDDTTTRKMTRACARSFMSRYPVPTLIISQNPLYYKPKENYTVDTRSIHMCLESDSSTKYGNLVHKRLPIDLSTFLSLDVRQMNRNLACITGITEANDREIPPAPVGRAHLSALNSNPLMRDIEKTPTVQESNPPYRLDWAREQKRDSLWRAFMVGWLFICGLAGATFAIGYMKFSSNYSASDDTASVIVTTVTAITAISTSSAATSSLFSSRSSAVMVSHTHTPLELPTVFPSIKPTSSVPPSESKADVSILLHDSKELSLGESEKFMIHVIGDNHIILRPPPSYLQLKKQPPLFIQVIRNGETVFAELSSLFDGVYTIKLATEDAWGSMNVTVWTKKKPIIRETFELDFGSPWIKLSDWINAVEQTKADLQKILKQATTDANQAVLELGNTAGHHALEIKDAVFSRAKELLSEVAKFYEVAKGADMRRYIPSVSDSVYVQKAQRQAKMVWEKRTKGSAVGEEESE
ncbi:hypothetical protein RUND412_006057 [Rhizina undulata]